LAFEVAQQLIASGSEVSLVAMIDTWSPGHHKRLSRPRALLADYSYRLQLIGADWQRVMAREQSVFTFLSQRVVYKKLLRLLGLAPASSETHVAFETRALSAEDYDQWLLGYVEGAAQKYEPRMFPGKLTLLCSAREPRGWFLDPEMGWGAFAAKGVEVAVIDGDHFTMFKGQGLEQMASQISQMNKKHDDQGTGQALQA
jgi:thioesterase domain-containing protein